MKVGLFIEKFQPTRGGRERSTGEMAHLLAESGCDVSIVCKRGIQEPSQPFKVIATGSCRFGRLTEAVSFNARCRKIIKQGLFDVTHTMFPVPGADIYQLRSGVIPAVRDAHYRRAGFIKHLSWHINLPRRYMWHLERKVIADDNTMILPVSTKVADDLSSYYGRTKRVRTVFNGVTIPQDYQQRCAEIRKEIRDSWSVTDDEIILLCPAMNPQLKGVGSLLDVFGQLKRSGENYGEKLRLVLVGRDTGLRTSDPPGVSRIEPVANIFPLYAACDAVILLSWYDACSRVVLESCAVGKPCITTSGNGAAEILSDGTGIVIDSPDSSDQLKSALEVITDKHERNRLAAAALAKAPQVSMKRHADQLLAIYEEIIENKK